VTKAEREEFEPQYKKLVLLLVGVYKRFDFNCNSFRQLLFLNNCNCYADGYAVVEGQVLTVYRFSSNEPIVF
jgi:hypothetical protein